MPYMCNDYNSRTYNKYDTEYYFSHNGMLITNKTRDTNVGINIIICLLFKNT